MIQLNFPRFSFDMIDRQVSADRTGKPENESEQDKHPNNCANVTFYFISQSPFTISTMVFIHIWKFESVVRFLKPLNFKLFIGWVEI